MGTKLFVNLPVHDLPASKAFFGALGFAFNAQFTDDTSACMVIGEDNYAMLTTHARFAQFTSKEIVDAKRGAEMLLSLGLASRADVDAMITSAVAAGGTTDRPPEDHGFMYEHGFYDLDGHGWGVFWMDPSFVRPA